MNNKPVCPVREKSTESSAAEFGRNGRFTLQLIWPLLLIGLFYTSTVIASLTGINEVRGCAADGGEREIACSGEECNPVPATEAGGRCMIPAAFFRRESGDGSPLEQRYLDGLRPMGTGRSGFEGETLFGELAGDWDQVSGFVAFPYSWDDIVDDYILLRGLPAERMPDSDIYRVTDWDRSAYWINIGDGRPRFLSSELLDSNYVPDLEDPNEPFEDSGELNYAQLVLYRVEGEDYSAYPEGAAFGKLFFLVDPDTGEAIDAVIDLYDANNDFDYTDYLYVGDELQPLLVTYVLDEPDTIYFSYYGDFITLSQDHTIERANYIPNVDFVDQDLADLDFDAVNAPLLLLLQGYAEPKEPNDDPVWAYSDVSPLGYPWGRAAVEIFNSRFESTMSPTVTSREHQEQVQIIRSRTD